jgi:hypothetical protein
MIRSKIKEKGLGADITDDKIREIKDSIKSKIRSEASPAVAPSTEDVVFDVPATQVTDEPGRIPSSVTQATTTDPNVLQVAKKEGELEVKQQAIDKREADVANREAELQRKKDELTYMPQIPVVLQGIEPEKVFIFDTNEISLGAEALSKTSFRTISNPDEKKSMSDLWIEGGVRQAEIFIAKFEKIGTITFDPFQGTSTFEEKKIEDAENPAQVPTDGLTPAQAQKSQEPSEPMSDAMVPVTDVSMPMSSDMGLQTIDAKSIIEKKVEDILRNYFLNQA